jgi:histidyl-tRNA synthetase
VQDRRSQTRVILPILKRLREKNVACELYPDTAKMQKQFSYADANRIPFVAIIGEEELKSNTITVKTMQNGHQEKMSIEQLIALLTTQ